MALTASQRRMASLLIGLAVKSGLSPQRAVEFAAAAYAESGLNPNATNKSSGAAGLFQLLSSGYRSRAKQLGGLYDPVANARAILPNYASYWKSHPNAAPGEAGRDVERSGEGAGFYSSPLSLVRGIPGNAGGGTSSPSLGAAPSSSNDLRRAIFQSLSSGGEIDILGLLRQRNKAAQMPMRAAGAPVMQASAPRGTPGGGLAEAFYDPLGSYDQGRFGGPIGGHSDHVHLSITDPQLMIRAIKYAQTHGLRVGENPYVDRVDPVHVKGSFHYRDFPGTYGGRRLGEAIDVSGSPALMAAFYKWATRRSR